MSKDLTVAIEKYTNANGEEKTKYLKIGVILSNQNGEYALLDPTINLAGIMLKQRLLNPQKAGGSVIASIFNNDNAAPASAPQPLMDDGFDDDIPL